ncbi:primosomal protein N' [Prochlorococcus sp. MIT 1300]|uniref:replication restart helicase PriA n=1 Tax=Prochlorococcus sp. MIT 1300 TaxID=3096218 RepID=UPI002A760E41|nr:primosomal protein N' [Prochlorococcus sp. MIT 1300]
MSSASLEKPSLPIEVDVWLEAGREGLSFTYKDAKNLGVDIGDLVQVRLRGRLMNGLVVGKRLSSTNKLNPQVRGGRPLQAVEALIQPAAVDTLWREWIEASAFSCHISAFRMLKAALPPGWLGQKPSRLQEPREMWWLQLEKDIDSSKGFGSKKQAELFNELVICGGGAWQRDLLARGFGISTMRSLIKNCIARREKKVFLQTPNRFNSPNCAMNVIEKPRDLTIEQQQAVETFVAQPAGSALCLWGVTGSGKTEVYLNLVAKEIKAGNNSLILTPEIGLVPQLVDRFRRRFGADVLEYHSNCSTRERINNWKRCLESDTPLVVVGTRSAVFLPMKKLGLIVLDEEHDSSYKQDSVMPCYHAKELALDRARRTGAKVLLGSATPSLSTWKSLKPQGSINLVRLTRRISSQPLPSVTVIDMRQELEEGNKRLVSRGLMESLSALPSSGEQAVVLVPRRGYSSFLSCRSCGEVVECPHCDVALTVHGSRNGKQWLRCHWCDYRETISSRCKACGSNAFKPFGAGTQRVMEHLSEELPEVRFLQFDRDTTGGRDGHRRLLGQFAAGEADVLVGTQMLAKGMDLPRVTLAAVLAADGLLHRPDLQAGEQSLQLMMQLAGRAGRGERPGKVIVQTYCPEHPVILHLLDGRYEEFLKKESQLRREAGLVPYSRACLLRLTGKSSSITATAAAGLAEQLRSICLKNGWCLIGPAPAPVSRVAGRSRWQILLHGPEKSPLPLPAGSTMWNTLPKGVALCVDPDPLEL